MCVRNKGHVGARVCVVCVCVCVCVHGAKMGRRVLHLHGSSLAWRETWGLTSHCLLRARTHFTTHLALPHGTNGGIMGT